MRILIVEDYEPLQKSLEQGLREAGFAVDVTGDGQEGLWYATGNEYDVIILDIMLPKLDGLEILKKLRADGRQSHVLILTAKDTLADKIEGLNLGADDYLVKPFAFEELLARVRALLRRSYQKKNPEIVIQILDLPISYLVSANKFEKEFCAKFMKASFSKLIMLFEWGIPDC